MAIQPLRSVINANPQNTDVFQRAADPGVVQNLSTDFIQSNLTSGVGGATNPADYGSIDPATGAPRTGLIGSEAALTAGATGAESALTGATASAIGNLQYGANLGRNDIIDSATAAQDVLAGPVGNADFGRTANIAGNTVVSALAQLEGGYTPEQAQALAGTASGAGASAGQFLDTGVNEAIKKGVQVFNPFLRQGQRSNQYQAALSGALGPEAQAEAYALFNESPGQMSLRDQAERSLLRNQAATGGLGGGRVLQELQKHAIGLAQQDFQQSFDRLGTLSDRGLQAGTQIGNLRGQQAGLASDLNIARGNAQTQANIASAQNATNASIANADALTRAGLAGLSEIGLNQRAGADVVSSVGRDLLGASSAAGLARLGAQENSVQSTAELLRGTGQDLASLGGQYAGQMADINLGLGGDIAGLRANLGAQLGAGRTAAGEAIAANVQDTVSKLSTAQVDQALNIAKTLGGNADAIAQALQQAGIAQGQ